MGCGGHTLTIQFNTLALGYIIITTHYLKKKIRKTKNWSKNILINIYNLINTILIL